MYHVYMYIGNFTPCCIYYTFIIAASNATSTNPQIGNSSIDSIPDSPVAVYKANVASGQLRYDEYQLSIVERLEQLHKTLENYSPPSESLLSQVCITE